jgi:6-phosphogluconolactonase
MQSIEIFDGPEALAAAARKSIRLACDEAIRDRGRFALALAGGSTPKRLYAGLSDTDLDLETTYFFFGDERNVPPDDERSNFGMARRAMFDRLDVKDDHIFRWRTELGPERAAEDYSGRLRSFFDGPPAFDLILLGLGADGHTASLFPGSDALTNTTDDCIANWVPSMNEWRLTLGFSAINNSQDSLFLVSGADKAEPVRRVFGEGDEQLPATRVVPRRRCLVLLDTASAGELPSKVDFGASRS